MAVSHVPYGFRLSYTVPLSKEDNLFKRNTVDNYRSISISPAISIIFEHCVLTKYSTLFETSSNQFGFKKKSSCSQAIYSLRKVVDHYVWRLNVNVCLLDLSKAFDEPFCLIY